MNETQLQNLKRAVDAAEAAGSDVTIAPDGVRAIVRAVEERDAILPAVRDLHALAVLQAEVFGLQQPEDLQTVVGKAYSALETVRAKIHRPSAGTDGRQRDRARDVWVEMGSWDVLDFGEACLEAGLDAVGEHSLSTYRVEHNPNCRDPYLVRMVGKGCGTIDGLLPAHTRDRLGYGATLSAALDAAVVANTPQRAPIAVPDSNQGWVNPGWLETYGRAVGNGLITFTDACRTLAYQIRDAEQLHASAPLAGVAEILECLDSHEPGARVLGNVTAGAARCLIRRIMRERAQGFEAMRAVHSRCAECECEECPQCSQPPSECSKTECSKSCECSYCVTCLIALAITSLETL